MANGYTLRPYQLEVIEDTEAALMFGSTNVVVESPPASGKSFLISETAYRLAKRHPNKKIVISITISALLDQIAHHLKLVGTDYSILKAGRDSEFDPEKQIQLCQAQTLHARIDKLGGNFPAVKIIYLAFLDFINSRPEKNLSGSPHSKLMPFNV